MAMSKRRTIWVCFPTAPYTHQSAIRACRSTLETAGWDVIVHEGQVREEDVPKHGVDVYLADYDLLPFEHIHPSSSTAAANADELTFPQLSSYVIRKSLIRKNYLAHSLHLARVKGHSQDERVHRVPLSPLSSSDSLISPSTWSFEATCADDLDELLADELYDVRTMLVKNVEQVDQSKRTWFILKPAMADQGMGIRLFDSVDRLEEIFAEFDNDDEGDESEEEQRGEETERESESTAVMISQVRQFVIQEYLAAPLLVRAPTLNAPHKFHLRAYVVAQGCLRVFLYDDMLALFAPLPYVRPGETDESTTELGSHLTNTSRQDDEQSSRTVHLLSDLLGCPINDEAQTTLSHAHLEQIRTRAAGVIAETFVACTKAGRIHFQPWPNAWEIFGVDLMVTLDDHRCADSLRVWLLEVNAQPDFAKSGPRLQEKIDALFARTLDICVLDQAAKTGVVEAESTRDSWPPGESRKRMTLCLDMAMNAEGW